MNIGDFGDFGDFDKFGNFGDVLICQFRQISSSIVIHTTWVNIGDFDKFGNFGDVLPISSN